MAKVEEGFRRRSDAYRARLEVRSLNTSAQRLCLSLGYTVTQRLAEVLFEWRRWITDGEIAIVEGRRRAARRLTLAQFRENLLGDCFERVEDTGSSRATASTTGSLFLPNS